MMYASVKHAGCMLYDIFEKRLARQDMHSRSEAIND